MKKLLNKTMMCISKRLLHVTFLCFMLLGFSGVAWAKTVYLNANNVNGIEWGKDGAWFFVHIWSDGGSSSNVKMNSVGNGYYSCDVPDGNDKIIFVRKNPAHLELIFDNKWGQTVDLSIPTDNNLFTPNDWDNCGGSWTTYGSSSEEEDLPDELPDAVYCGVKQNTIFKETFGNLSTVKSRTSSSYVPNNYSYVKECDKINSAGSYAIVANPRYSGCTSYSDGGDYGDVCSCDPKYARLWYQDCGDHTGTNNADGNAAGSLGGMLQLDCNNGSDTDVMYQRTVTGICKNTLINFSVWLKCATKPGDYNNDGKEDTIDPIDARVILRKGGPNGKIIGRKDIHQVDLSNQKWFKLTAMFKSVEDIENSDEITIQFINKAKYGQFGNDLLVDDIELSVCTPDATLKTSNGTPDASIILGQTETLKSEITSGVMEDPFYLWQVKDSRTGTWINLIEQAVKDKATFVVTPNAPSLEYRVIIAPSLEDIDNALANVNSSDDVCGMYAITNVVTITAKPINVEIEGTSAICLGDEAKFTITVTNPLEKAVSNVKLRIVPPTSLESDPTVSPSSTYSNKVWTIASLPKGTSTFTYEAKSTGIGQQLPTQVYISEVGNIKYTSYDDVNLPEDSKDITKVTLNPLPEALFSVNKETICDGSTTSEIAINVNNGTPNYTLTVDGIDYSTSTVPYIFKVSPSTTKIYTLTQVKDSKGCIYKPTQNNTATVTVEKLSITTQPTTQTVCVGGQATFTVVAEGANKYTWEVSKDNKTWELIADASTTSSTYTTPAVTANDNGKYYRVNVCKDGGKCGIITSNSAELKVTTIDKPTLKNNGKYDECYTTGDISLSNLFSGTDLKYYSDSELKSEITTGTFSASEIVEDKPYYATQTINGCTSDAAVATVTVKQLPTLTSVVTNKNAICGTETDSKATLTYNITGGKSPYGLTIQRIEGNSTSTITTEVKLVSGGTYDVQPSSDATYKFIKVSDSNGCYSQDEDGLVDDITIDVQNIILLENLANRIVCADKTLDYTIKASGDNLNYQWYESIDNGVTFNRVGTNSSSYRTNAFAIKDKKQYKVEVYQSPEVCSAIKSKESAVTVTDCSSLSLGYGLESKSATVCMGEEIKFKYTLTNNSDAANITVNITNIANQTLKGTANASLGEYDHEKGVWEVGKIAKDAEATLEITIVGSTAVKDKVSTVYVSKAGTTEYTMANTIAISTQTITVKNITKAPTLIAETYKACPKSGMLDLETQISSDKTNLKFYTSETGTTYVKQASKSTEGTTTYWVSNKVDGECESPRTQLDIVVYPQPTAKLTGDATICKGDPAYLAIKLSGTPNYTVTYTANVDGTETDNTQNRISDSEFSVPVYPTETTTYSLKEVKDDNECLATISGGATVTVNYPPTINGIPKDLSVVHVCDGDVLPLPTLTIIENGSTITKEEWYFNGKLYKEGDAVSFTEGIKDKELQLEYLVSNSCGDTREKVGLFIIEPRPELVSFEI